ncbi:hypothetical protein C8Q75DRAFT_372949 [Abortiporus biennis]|nr:hypothetical protein C8Q75DRAFT_372949 [Abortiporus biennis]
MFDQLYNVQNPRFFPVNQLDPTTTVLVRELSGNIYIALKDTTPQVVTSVLDELRSRATYMAASYMQSGIGTTSSASSSSHPQSSTNKVASSPITDLHGGKWLPPTVPGGRWTYQDANGHTKTYDAPPPGLSGPQANSTSTFNHGAPSVPGGYASSSLPGALNQSQPTAKQIDIPTSEQSLRNHRSDATSSIIDSASSSSKEKPSQTSQHTVPLSTQSSTSKTVPTPTSGSAPSASSSSSTDLFAKLKSKNLGRDILRALGRYPPTSSSTSASAPSTSTQTAVPTQPAVVEETGSKRKRETENSNSSVPEKKAKMPESTPITIHPVASTSQSSQSGGFPYPQASALSVPVRIIQYKPPSTVSDSTEPPVELKTPGVIELEQEAVASSEIVNGVSGSSVQARAIPNAELEPPIATLDQDSSSNHMTIDLTSTTSDGSTRSGSPNPSLLPPVQKPASAAKKSQKPSSDAKVYVKIKKSPPKKSTASTPIAGPSQIPLFLPSPSPPSEHEELAPEPLDLEDFPVPQNVDMKTASTGDDRGAETGSEVDLLARIHIASSPVPRVVGRLSYVEVPPLPDWVKALKASEQARKKSKGKGKEREEDVIEVSSGSEDELAMWGDDKGEA